MVAESDHEVISLANDKKVNAVEDTGRNSRQQWSSQLEFLFACVGSAVGLGNAWRFPYLCYENGGGAFLLPYIIMFLICGLPLFFMEICLGQFASQGPLTIWNFCPLFKGIGIGVIMICTFLYIYYNVIMSWTIYYAVKSISFPSLPWTTCDHEWNTPYCFDDIHNTTRELGNTVGSVRASEEFWKHKVHELADDMGDLVGMNWHLLLCLILSWFVVYLSLLKGIKSLGKVVYFTALIPYFFLGALLVKGITLPGAWDGIKIYLIPKFGDLLAVKPWRDAAAQICFSLGISIGTKMTLASYNDFHNNCFRDTLYVVTINCCTSVFAGFAIFSVLGFMAYDSNQRVEDVLDSGIGLAFIAYPEGLARLPGSQIWSFLFFIMLFTLGVDSEIILVECIVTGIMDSLPSKLRKWRHRVTIAVCVAGLLLSSVMVTKSGLYIFKLVDWYTAKFSLTIYSAIFPLTVCYIYGLSRFCSDVKVMMGSEPGFYWKICLAVIAPITLLVVSLTNFVIFTPIEYNGYVFPTSAQVVGWIISMSSFAAWPLYMIFALITVKPDAGGGTSVWQRVLLLTKPNVKWGPRLLNHRIEAGYN